MRTPEENQDVAGRNGFVWWVGVVEARNDPLKLGRCQVRIGGGWHSDNKMKLPTADLPWAIPSLPVNNVNPYAPKEGDMVFGFFLDGANAKEPVMVGVMPGIPLNANTNPQQAFTDPRTAAELAAAPVRPDEKKTNYPRKIDEPTTSRLARNDTDYPHAIIASKKSKKSNLFELDSPYAAKYPYDNVIESESGHVIEIDDTPDKERLHFYHRSGTYYEYRPDGTTQQKVVKDSYQAVDANKNVYVKGNYTVNVDGNLTFNVKGNIGMKAGGSISGTAGSSISWTAGSTFSAFAPASASMTAVGAASVTAGGMASMTAGGMASVTAGGAAAVTAGGAATFTAAGAATLSGSVVNIFGSPVGGAAGAAAAGAGAASAIGGASGAALASLSETMASIAGTASDLLHIDAQGLILGTPTLDSVIDPGAFGGQLGSAINEVGKCSVELSEAIDFQNALAIDIDNIASTELLPTGFDRFLTNAQNVGQSILDAAAKVDPESLVKDAAQDLWKATTGPFYVAGENISRNYDILTSGTATFKDQFKAAQAIIGQGSQLYGNITNLQNFSPEQLITQYSTSTFSNATSQFVSSLDKDSTLLNIKGDVKNLLGGYANNISQTFSDITLPMNDYINKITDNFKLSQQAAALEISQQIVDLRAKGFTEAEIKELIPNMTTESLKKFAREFEGAPATSNQIQDDYDNTGLIRT
jgi:hypothetical protein